MDRLLREKLKKEADLHGWRITREIEERLGKSLEGPQAGTLGEGDDREFAMRAVRLAGMIRLYISDWWDDPCSFREFQAGVEQLLSDRKPKGEVVVPKQFEKMPPGAVGQFFAMAILAEGGVKKEEPQLSLEERKRNQRGIEDVIKTAAAISKAEEEDD
jgi:hypothetical protein